MRQGLVTTMYGCHICHRCCRFEIPSGGQRQLLPPLPSLIGSSSSSSSSSFSSPPLAFAVTSQRRPSLQQSPLSMSAIIITVSIVDVGHCRGHIHRRHRLLSWPWSPLLMLAIVDAISIVDINHRCCRCLCRHRCCLRCHHCRCLLLSPLPPPSPSIIAVDATSAVHFCHPSLSPPPLASAVIS